MSNKVENTIQVIKTVPAALQLKRMEINAYLKKRIVTAKVEAFTKKAMERPMIMAATLNHAQL